MLVLKLIDSSLYDFIQCKDLDVVAAIVLPMLRDVVKGMIYLHRMNLVPKDLKAKVGIGVLIMNYFLHFPPRPRTYWWIQI